MSVAAPRPQDDLHRLETLRMYRVLDTKSEKAFDDLTRLAASICDVPMAMISLVDENRQWFKARVGMSEEETARDSAFCSHAIMEDQTFIVPDSHADIRFTDNELVTGSPFIRFYAGAPLKVADGSALGTLCVVDHIPRVLTPRQLEALEILRDAVVTQLELRRATADLHILSQVLPICAWCRSVRGDDESWTTADDYLKHSVSVTHGICPTCATHLTHPAGN